MSSKGRLGALKEKERCGEGETQRRRIRSKPNQLHGLAGQREGGGGAWALRTGVDPRNSLAGRSWRLPQGLPAAGPPLRT